MPSLSKHERYNGERSERIHIMGFPKARYPTQGVACYRKIFTFFHNE